VVGGNDGKPLLGIAMALNKSTTVGARSGGVTLQGSQAISEVRAAPTKVGERNPTTRTVTENRI